MRNAHAHNTDLGEELSKKMKRTYSEDEVAYEVTEESMMEKMFR